MNLNFDDKLKSRYLGKPIIVPVYQSRKKEYYSIDDIKDFAQLKYFLGEVNNHEAYITTSGISFLKDVFGFEKLAIELHKDQWFSDEFSDTKSILDWLESWEKEAHDQYNK